MGSRNGAVVRALAFHLCDLDSISVPYVCCCWFSLCSEGFLRIFRFSSLYKGQHCKNSNSNSTRIEDPYENLLRLIFYLNIVINSFLFYFCLLATTMANRGTYKFIHFTIPDECGPGLYSPTGIAKCFTCPSGTYSAQKRNKACSNCPAGTLTVISAAKGIEDCGSECCF